MHRVLVIGATGNIGQQVVSQLLASGSQVRAMTRTPQTAGLPPPTQVVYGDLTLPDTLPACLEGTDAVFLVWTAPPAAVAPALQQIARHAPRIVFLSAPLKTPHPFFQQPNPARALVERIEQVIQASDLSWTFLRPGIFAANALPWWGSQIRAGDVVRWPYLGVPTAPIHEHDVAAVALRALCETGHANAEYVLTGPQSLTQAEQVSAIGRALGRSLRVEELTPDEARRKWGTFMPAPVVNMLLDAWAASAGQPAFVTSTVAELTGAPARTFLVWAKDHAADFRA
jgi:uncharacterized protein YbjT (DUF2867 family)